MPLRLTTPYETETETEIGQSNPFIFTLKHHVGKILINLFYVAILLVFYGNLPATLGHLKTH